jgi:hypothetical protein
MKGRAPVARRQVAVVACRPSLGRGRYVRSADPTAAGVVAGRDAGAVESNGREIFYRDGNKMMAVDVTAAGDDLKLSPVPCSSSGMPSARALPSPTTTCRATDEVSDGERRSRRGPAERRPNAFADLPR